jgi:hypothetical protein
MKPTRKLSRRSFLAQVAGGVAGVGALAVIGADPARAATQSGCSDSDSGAYGDPAGNGRRCGSGTDSDPTDSVGEGRGGRSGVSDNDPSDPAGGGWGSRNCTDRDTGRNADPIGRGRRCGGRRWTGVTDSDSGANGDPANYGQRGGNRACTDRDSGRNADPAGRGRRCGGRAWTGVTDSDSGNNRDPASYGRGRNNCSDSDSGRNGDPGGRGRRC